MKKLIQVAVVLLLFTSIVSVSFAGVSANASNADRGTSLYLTRLETFYDVKATSVPVYCVVADFSDSIISAPPRYITSVTAHMPWGTETKEGMWRPLRVSGLLNKETWDNAWTSFCRPGVKNKSQIESVKPIERLLKDEVPPVKLTGEITKMLAPWDEFLRSSFLVVAVFVLVTKR